MKRERIAKFPVMSRRHFGVLASSAAAGVLLSHSGLASAQQVRVATKVGSGVAANPQDRFIVEWSSWGGRYLWVYTRSGEVYAHKILAEGQIGAPWRVGAVHAWNRSVQGFGPDPDRGCIFMLRSDGQVLSYRVDAAPNGDPVAIGPETLVRVPSPVFVNPRDRTAIRLRDRYVVIRDDGTSGLHRIESATQWSAGMPTAPDSARIFSNPQDRWLINVCGERIGVITKSGELYVHGYDFARDTVLPATRATMDQLIGINPQDRLVTSFDDVIYVVTQAGDVYAHRVDC